MRKYQKTNEKYLLIVEKTISLEQHKELWEYLQSAGFPSFPAGTSINI